MVVFARCLLLLFWKFFQATDVHKRSMSSGDAGVVVEVSRGLRKTAGRHRLAALLVWGAAAVRHERVRSKNAEARQVAHWSRRLLPEDGLAGFGEPAGVSIQMRQRNSV